MRRSVPEGRTSQGKDAGRIPALALALSLVAACGGDRFEADPYDLDFAIPRSEPFAATLSSYRLFEGPMASLEPAARVHLYDLSSELFTDYASKQRLLRVPEGTTVQVLEDGTLAYPEGTVMAKTFYYGEDMRDASSPKRIIETRLLVKTRGQWNVATYLWNEAQTEATLLLTGTTTAVSWLDGAGPPRATSYVVPHEGECVTCHQRNGASSFIGPTLRNLNREFERGGDTVNQLAYLEAEGVFDGLDLEAAPSLPDYEAPSEPLDLRARAYLDINCAHCHRPEGWDQASRRAFDFRFSTPLEATGILGQGGQVARQLTEGTMPFLGTTLPHDEGVQLVVGYVGGL